MGKGFFSKIDMEKEISDIKEGMKEGIKEAATVSKEVYESVESRGIYNTMSLDEQLSNQLYEMKKEQERLEYIKQGSEAKEESKNKSYECKQEKTDEFER